MNNNSLLSEGKLLSQLMMEEQANKDDYLVFDDCQSPTTETKELIEKFSSGRHYKINAVIEKQKMIHLPMLEDIDNETRLFILEYNRNVDEYNKNLEE